MEVGAVLGLVVWGFRGFPVLAFSSFKSCPLVRNCKILLTSNDCVDILRLWPQQPFFELLRCLWTAPATGSKVQLIAP